MKEKLEKKTTTTTTLATLTTLAKLKPKASFEVLTLRSQNDRMSKPWCFTSGFF